MAGEYVAPHEAIKKVFAVLLEEIERNPALGNKILKALPASVAKAERPQPRRNAFNALEYHPINILRTHGARMLRGKLTELNNREKLRAVAKAANLVLDPKALRPKATVNDVVEAIVQAAESYDRKRTAAID